MTTSPSKRVASTADGRGRAAKNHAAPGAARPATARQQGSRRLWETREVRALVWLAIILAVIWIFEGAAFILVHVFNVLLLFIFAGIVALILTPLVDSVLLVVRSGTTSKPAIHDAVAAIEASKLLGVVLNEAA